MGDGPEALTDLSVGEPFACTLQQDTACCITVSGSAVHSLRYVEVGFRLRKALDPKPPSPSTSSRTRDEDEQSSSTGVTREGGHG